MPLAFPEPAYMPCDCCGASVARSEQADHICDAERVHAYRLFPFRGEVAAFDSQLAGWLATARGQFAMWIAERDRRGLAA